MKQPKIIQIEIIQAFNEDKSGEWIRFPHIVLLYDNGQVLYFDTEQGKAIHINEFLPKFVESKQKNIKTRNPLNK